jgi:uncharacterized Fe-S cluster-containing radical SAM superfamily protein
MQQLDPPKEQKNIYSVPFLAKQEEEFVLWYFTGSKCNLECTHCYVESSPRADKHPYLTYSSFKARLDEALKMNYKDLEIYFTGGEPFLNPDILKMFEESMKYANTTVLTNATRITDLVAKKLSEIQQRSKYEIFFRVSLDGPNAASNDAIRGENTFKRAIGGIKNLFTHDFLPIITAMQSWPLLRDGAIRDEFSVLLANMGIEVSKQKLKILPPLRIGRETTRNRPYSLTELFTPECFTDYDYRNLQCSKCRIVSENGVFVCPILVNEDHAKMGNTLEEAAKSYEMRDMACWTCRMEGMNCAND